ncbi:CADM3 protein, partial [Corythaeola cristata]|nr:CADM3 protein [Corythaeola cristata]
VPQKPQIFGHEQPIDEEKIARLTCQSSGSKPAAQLRWKKGNKELKDEGTQVMEDPNGKTFTVSSRVEFRVTKEDNEAEVTCTVDHESLQNSERSTTQKLQVHCTWHLGMTGQGCGGVGEMEEVSASPQRRDAVAHRSARMALPRRRSWHRWLSPPCFPRCLPSSCARLSSSVCSRTKLVAPSRAGSGPPRQPSAARSGPWEQRSPQRLLLSVFSPCAIWADASPVPSTSSTYHAVIGGVVAVIVFLLLSLLIVLGHYLIRHKGTYLTHEAKGSDDAPDADTAIINAEGGQASGDDKKEYFI